MSSQQKPNENKSEAEDIFAELTEMYPPNPDETTNNMFSQINDDDGMEEYTSLMDDDYEDIRITFENDEYLQELCPDEVDDYIIEDADNRKWNTNQDLCPVENNMYSRSPSQELCLDESKNANSDDDDALMMTGQSPPTQASLPGIKQEKNILA